MIILSREPRFMARLGISPFSFSRDIFRLNVICNGRLYFMQGLCEH